MVIGRDGSACWCMWYLLMMGLGLVIDLCLSADWRVYIFGTSCACVLCVYGIVLAPTGRRLSGTQCVWECAAAGWRASLRDSVCVGVSAADWRASLRDSVYGSVPPLTGGRLSGTLCM